MYTPVHVGHVQQHFQPSRHLHLKLELQTKKIREKKTKTFTFSTHTKNNIQFLTPQKLSLWLFHPLKNFHFHFLTSPPVFPPFVGCPPPRPPLPPSLVSSIFRGGGCWSQSLTTFITKLLIGRWLWDSDKDYLRTWLNVWCHDSRCLPSSWQPPCCTTPVYAPLAPLPYTLFQGEISFPGKFLVWWSYQLCCSNIHVNVLDQFWYTIQH